MNNTAFLNGLGALFAANTGKGTVFVSQKRRACKEARRAPRAAVRCVARRPSRAAPAHVPHAADPADVPRGAAGEAPRPAVCLYRATDGRGTKLTTAVPAAEAARFHAAFITVLRAGMSALKKVKKAKKGARAAAS